MCTFILIAIIIYFHTPEISCLRLLFPLTMYLKLLLLQYYNRSGAAAAIISCDATLRRDGISTLLTNINTDFFNFFFLYQA